MRAALVLLGYFPKRVQQRPEWLQAPVVKEIASVSLCISNGPDNWIDQWRHNTWGFYDSSAAAWEVVEPGDRETFEMFAFELYPSRFANGRWEQFRITGVNPSPLNGSFVAIGYDVVSKSVSAFFECSPLSCNGMAAEAQVNAYCLVDTLDIACQLAETFEEQGCEPGPYYVIRVLRGESAA
jgi:hypothetical protein